MQRELPTNTTDWSSIGMKMPRGADDNRLRVTATRESTATPLVPINEYDALMRTAPGEDPRTHELDQLALRDAVADCIQQLDERSQFVIEAVHSERLSYRQLADRLGFSAAGAHKLVQRAEEQLERLMMNHPSIKERVAPTTWNTAAHEALLSIAPVGVTMTDTAAEDMIRSRVATMRTHVNAVADGMCGFDPFLAASCCRLIGVAATHMLDNRGLWDVEEILALLVRKQHDYGHENILSMGMLGVCVRDSDKVARWFNLNGEEGLAEPAIDALLDMVGYATIVVMLTRETFTLELAS